MLMTYEEIQHCLRNSKGVDVTAATGIGKVALSKLRVGHVKNPRYDTLQKLTAYFNENPVTEKEEVK